MLDVHKHRLTMAWTWIERAHGAKPDSAYRKRQLLKTD